VPPPVIDSFIRNAIDHVINQVFRALKCLRDGGAPAARLEAAEMTALLDVLFALNGGRLRPYYKYLTWELTTHPLEHCPWGAEELVTKLVEFSSRPDSTQLQTFAAQFERTLRAHGFGEVFDDWGDALPWILGASAALPWVLDTSSQRQPRRWTCWASGGFADRSQGACAWRSSPPSSSPRDESRELPDAAALSAAAPCRRFAPRTPTRALATT
jgi:hypothetical protein